MAMSKPQPARTLPNAAGQSGNLSAYSLPSKSSGQAEKDDGGPVEESPQLPPAQQ